MQTTCAEEVDRLLAEMEREEPVSDELGTPDLVETDASRRLVAMGSAAVPPLLEHLRRGISARRAAYAVRALARIGDPRVLPELQALRARHQALDQPGEWDFAVIGQCTLAIRALGGDGE